MAIAVGRPVTARPKTKRRTVRFNAEAKTAFVFLLPATIGFLVFYAYPALRGFYLSFTNFDLLRNDGRLGRAGQLPHAAGRHAVLERAVDHLQVRDHQHRRPDRARARDRRAACTGSPSR